MSNKIDRIWAFAILFMNGWSWALPVTSEALPVWFTPVQVVHGIFIHELLLILYLGFLVVTRGGHLPIRKHAPGNNIAFLIIGLGCLGILFSRIFLVIDKLGEKAQPVICSLVYGSWDRLCWCNKPLLFVYHPLYGVGGVALVAWPERTRRLSGAYGDF